MNALESLIVDQIDNKSETKFKNGVYIILRHNTMDVTSITNEFGRLYRLLFKIVKGEQYDASKIYSTFRFPVENRVSRCIGKQHPIMISSVQQKQKDDRACILSHHLLYGTHWNYKYDVTDQSLVGDISSTVPRYLETVHNKRTNILIQPVGETEEQSADRFSEDEFYAYISNYVNDEEIDTLLTHMMKQSPTGMKYAFQYSYAI